MTFTISYDPLWETLSSQSVKKIDLVRQGIVTPAALKRLQKGEPVSLNVLGNICVGLGVGPEEVMAFKALDGTIPEMRV